MLQSLFPLRRISGAPLFSSSLTYLSRRPIFSFSSRRMYKGGTRGGRGRGNTAPSRDSYSTTSSQQRGGWGRGNTAPSRDSHSTSSSSQQEANHHVAHVVARHHAGKIVKSIWYGMVMLVASFASGFDLRKATKMSGVHWKIPFSRRMEKEADYVSLMLMASAGYDPQITPAVYEKLADASTTITTKAYLSTHPSLKKRARSLAQTKVMEEAVSIYKDFRASRGVADFIDREDQNENEKENSVKYLDGNSNEEDSVGKDDYELCNEEDSVGKDDYEL